MNDTITTEELLALSKSADLLRQTAEKAMRCDDLAQQLQIVRGHHSFEVAENAKLRDRIGELLRENETLARNTPPASVFDTPSGTAAAPMPDPIIQYLGQRWCRVNREDDVPPNSIGDRRRGGFLVLCDAHEDIQTGALTYRPLAVEDLPLVT